MLYVRGFTWVVEQIGTVVDDKQAGVAVGIEVAEALGSSPAVG